MGEQKRGGQRSDSRRQPILDSAGMLQSVETRRAERKREQELRATDAGSAAPGTMQAPPRTS